MSTRLIDALSQVGTHAVGNLNNHKIKTLNYGAIVAAPAPATGIDNFTLVELDFDANGERICLPLADKTHKAYLIATPEFRPMGEALVDFYNANGERARIVILEPGYTRFDTSAYTLNAGVVSIAAGQVAHFDVATGKFIISDAGAPHADYAGSSAQFVVVSNEDDLVYTNGQALVRLECTKA